MRGYKFSDGAVAFSNGYFILVIGSSQSEVTGYGKFAQKGEALTLIIIHWTKTGGVATRNIQDVSLLTFFDSRLLNLADGTIFDVIN